MHERNPYKDGVDFFALAQAYPPLKPHLFTTAKGTPSIDFKDVIAQRALTKALLHRDFNLSLTIPHDRLCPAVPNRLDYVLWIQDLLDSSDMKDPILGLDIGTGASAIYPLLACRQRSDWRMIGADVDERSIETAKQNVQANGLQDRIAIYCSLVDGPKFAAIRDHPTEKFAFTMCNPPFYSSKEDFQASAEAKEFDPHAVCTGADVEMITAGGEVGFVTDMIVESLELKERCRWYTSLFGKSSSVLSVVTAFRTHKITNYAITEFTQSHTKRWAVAWSFGEDRLPDRLSRIPRHQFSGYMPLPNELSQSYPGVARETVQTILVQIVTSLPTVKFTHAHRISVSASANCWSRSARRKKQELLPPNTPPALRCELWVEGEGDSGTGTVAYCRWVKGRDRELFESFWSHVSRKVADQTK